MDVWGNNNIWLLAVGTLWALPWKGYALWTASKKNHKRWFIALILINTFGLLEIFYIFYIAKKTPKDLGQAFKTKL